MLPMWPWEQPLRRANGRRRRRDNMKKNARKLLKPRRYTTKPSGAHSRSCENGDSKGGVADDHGGGLLPNTLGAPGGDVAESQ